MGRIASRRTKPDRLEEVLGYFPRLRERLRQFGGTMSGGEQQMLAIGCGLMTDPKAMLLDEQSDGIMPTLVAQIAVTLARVNQERGRSVERRVGQGCVTQCNTGGGQDNYNKK